MYANEWKKNAISVMDKIEATQMEKIQEVAKVMADCIQSGHMVHTFGCGHANLPIEEMYRWFRRFSPTLRTSSYFLHSYRR